MGRDSEPSAESKDPFWLVPKSPNSESLDVVEVAQGKALTSLWERSIEKYPSTACRVLSRTAISPKDDKD
jgi:hypothetical protein